MTIIALRSREKKYGMAGPPKSHKDRLAAKLKGHHEKPKKYSLCRHTLGEQCGIVVENTDKKIPAEQKQVPRLPGYR